MATLTYLKKKRQQATAHIIGTGNATISMQSLALDDETIDFANVAPRVNISSIYYTTSSNVAITRNGNLILDLYDTDNWELAQASGVVINIDNSSNIVVDFGTGRGTVLLTVTKVSGFQEPDQQRFVSGN